MTTIHDSCDSCGQDYEFVKGRDVMVIYLTAARYNHIQATCPCCSNVAHVYLGIEAILCAIQQCQLEIHLYADVHTEIAEERETIDEVASASAVEPPREWLRELYDDLRNFGAGTGE
jgi:hypothetical protein